MVKDKEELPRLCPLHEIATTLRAFKSRRMSKRSRMTTAVSSAERMSLFPDPMKDAI